MLTLCAIALLAAFGFTRLQSASAQSRDYLWKPVASGLKNPTTLAWDSAGRLFVTEQGGTIQLVENGKTHLFLTIPEVNSRGVEQGLLGLALHPDFTKNGQLFVVYTDANKQPTLARYTASDPNFADPASAKVLLTTPHPYDNHNGGQIAFGPDGYLYWGIGDGGSGGDPANNGQSLKTLLAKIVRLDVNGASLIPADNPFANRADARGEIWAYGLRNPWRFSFDRKTGDLFIADVGQNAYEEVNYQPATSKGGENYGWSAFEANHNFKAEGDSRPTGLIFPVAEYPHGDAGCSVTGGYVYRGAALPALDGAYLYGDYCSGQMWTLHRDASGAWQNQPFMKTEWNMTSFGQDPAGELYMADRGGTLYRLEAAAK